MPEGPSDLELRRRQFKAQMSTVQTRRQQAVCVRRAYKKYGSKSNPYIILDGLNMTVPKGAIYGLLGASGCGKTTLLNCIIGRKRLNSGEIWVLGGKPGSRGSGVPGPRVGYMPQETALYGEFTIRETLKYFGWISGMTVQQVEERLEFLVSFLMLPDADRLVKNLSGGQQRRVSLAATLIHEPELLILDEPTVGVDPLLRQNIWNHLVEITKHGRTTVIITTHYIDETRQAHLIGLMRGGYFLAEESPERLISQFCADSLEDVFLKLSVIQNMGKRRRSSILQGVTEAIRVPSGTVNEAAVLDDEVGEISGEFGDNVSMSSRGGRVSIAPEPIESAPPELPPEEEPPVAFSPSLEKLLVDVEERGYYGFYYWFTGTSNHFTYYPTVKEGQEPVRQGKSWATLVFANNFSDAIRARVNDGRSVSDADLNSSTVHVYQDKSNENIGSYVQRDFKVGTIPIHWEKPLYGYDNPDFTDFAAPGVILTCCCFMCLR
ncbi:ABC transporter G family member, partial [Asbolus verrucosus]